MQALELCFCALLAGILGFWPVTYPFPNASLQHWCVARARLSAKDQYTTFRKRGVKALFLGTSLAYRLSRSFTARFCLPSRRYAATRPLPRAVDI